MFLALALMMLQIQPIKPLLYAKVEKDVQIPIVEPNGNPAMSEFWLQWYPYAGSAPRPLVVAFHGHSIGEAGPFNSSKLPLKCNQRGWLLLSPLGRYDVDHGTDFAQFHVEEAIDHVIANYAVDTDRIYVIGFSGGGGFALSYASRHQDPDRPRIAAVVNHTGVISQRASYDTSPNCNCCDPGGNDRRSAYRGVIGSQFMPLSGFCASWGGPPAFDYSTADTPFFYQRSSALDLVNVAGQFVPTADPQMCTNLIFTPARTYYDPLDPTSRLVDFNVAFDAYMTSIGANHQAFTLSNGGVHEWNALPYNAIFNWLNTKTLGLPPAGQHNDTVADEDGRFAFFDITQQQTDALSQLRWYVGSPGAAAGPNSINFAFGPPPGKTVNISSVVFDWQLAGLQDDGLKVQLNTELAAGDLQSVILPDFVQPLSVNIFQAAGGTGMPSWMWNEYPPMGSGIGDLVLTRGDEVYHTFTIDVP